MRSLCLVLLLCSCSCGPEIVLYKTVPPCPPNAVCATVRVDAQR